MSFSRLARTLAAASLLLSSEVFAQGDRRPRDSFGGADKMRHFFISGFIESVAFSGLRAAGVGHDAALGSAVAGTAVVTIGRELHDRRSKGLFSFGDLFWNAVGAGAALLILTRTPR